MNKYDRILKRFKKPVLDCKQTDQMEINKQPLVQELKENIESEIRFQIKAYYKCMSDEEVVEIVKEALSEVNVHQALKDLKDRWF